VCVAGNHTTSTFTACCARIGRPRNPALQLTGRRPAAERQGVRQIGEIVCSTPTFSMTHTVAIVIGD